MTCTHHYSIQQKNFFKLKISCALCLISSHYSPPSFQAINDSIVFAFFSILKWVVYYFIIEFYIWNFFSHYHFKCFSTPQSNCRNSIYMSDILFKVPNFTEDLSIILSLCLSISFSMKTCPHIFKLTNLLFYIVQPHYYDYYY
jgi:hypothetical protein